MVCVPSTSVSKNAELSLMLRGTVRLRGRWTTGTSQSASTDSTICGCCARCRARTARARPRPRGRSGCRGCPRRSRASSTIHAVGGLRAQVVRDEARADEPGSPPVTTMVRDRDIRSSLSGLMAVKREGRAFPAVDSGMAGPGNHHMASHRNRTSFQFTRRLKAVSDRDVDALRASFLDLAEQFDASTLGDHTLFPLQMSWFYGEPIWHELPHEAALMLNRRASARATSPPRSPRSRPTS